MQLWRLEGFLEDRACSWAPGVQGEKNRPRAPQHEVGPSPGVHHPGQQGVLLAAVQTTLPTSAETGRSLLTRGPNADPLPSTRCLHTLHSP